ncbi:relaxase/mobilization nuclease domain-containing protein [Streptomyces sp. NPDC058745]|uniref:relaxase/mobilization nuclease domain-containing protein n=1 Tax=Streptomyces sp. NPDC058745 TaxID=3346621 RepID=UPI0036B4B8E3
MPKKARDGNDTHGLLAYLYGPGKRDEHVDARLVAAWGPYIDDPARSPTMTLSDLALLLDAPVSALPGPKPAKHVYHVAVRNAPEDRLLTDAEWAEIAREMMHSSGIAPRGDEEGCRWVAVRHADDHVHIVATQARQDGRQPRLRRDIVNMHASARAFEEQLGLRRLTHGDKTPRRWSKTGEKEKAERRGMEETPRESLQRSVRQAAALATGEADFFARLGTAGIRMQQRNGPDGSIIGYSVASPGDRDGSQLPVWFSGSRLAPDLSLPRVRERWLPAVPETRIEPAEMWRVAEEKVKAAAERLGAGRRPQGAGDVAALGDLIVVAGEAFPRPARGQVTQAAYEFERASRAPGDRALEGEARALFRDSMQALSQGVSAVGRNDAAAALGFMLALVTAVDAARRWHEAQAYRPQAESAARSGELLREALEVTTGAVAAKGSRQRPKRAAAALASFQEHSAATERRMADIVQQAVPQHTSAVVSDASWPTMRSRLVEVEHAGDDPVAVLAAVAAQRELGSAESIAQVLAWRLDGWRRQRSSSAAAAQKGPATTVRGGGGLPRPGRAAAASAQILRRPGDEQRKGPRRAR